MQIVVKNNCCEHLTDKIFVIYQMVYVLSKNFEENQNIYRVLSKIFGELSRKDNQKINTR